MVRSPSFWKVDKRCRYRSAGLILWSALLTWACGAEPSARPAEPATASDPVFYSTTQRFAARGMASAEKLSMLRLAEQVADEVESRLGVRLPYQRIRPLVFLGKTVDAQGARVIRRQDVRKRHLFQELELIGPDRVHPEALLEGMCWLMMNAAACRGTVPEGQPAPEISEWFSCGFAQDLYPALRARNRKVVLGQWDGPEAFSLADITSWRYLPAGFWPEKAHCGSLFAWLRSIRSPEGVPGLLLARARPPGRPNLDDLAAALPVHDYVGLQQEWDLWVAALRHRRYEIGSFDAEDLAELRSLVSLTGARWAAVGGLPPGRTLTLDLMLAERQAPWVGEVAAALHLELRRVGLGRAVDLQDVVAVFTTWLEALVQPAEGMDQDVLERTLSLRGDLARARASLVQLETEYRQLDLRLQQAEARLGSQPGAEETDPELGAYLDEVERRLYRPTPVGP